MKRIRSLLVLPLFTLSACTQPLDAKTIYASIMDTMASYDSYSATGTMELKMDIPLDPDNPDSTIGLTIPIDMTMKLADLKTNMNMDLTMDMSILGQTINYDFYLRDQYIYMEVLDQKGAVAMDPSLQTMMASTYAFQNDPTTLDDPNLQFDMVQTDKGEGIKITMNQAYFDSQMNTVEDLLGQANVSLDTISDFSMVQTIYYDDTYTITHMDLNGQLSVSSMPFNLSLSVDYHDYDSTTLISISPNDYPITTDGSISADIPLSNMV